MSGFTPGPWHVGGDIRVTNDNRIRRNVWGPTPPGMQSGEMVCQLATVDNARLIAAAPELLEALEEIVGYTGGADSALQDEYVIARVRAAIDKARGNV